MLKLFLHWRKYPSNFCQTSNKNRAPSNLSPKRIKKYFFLFQTNHPQYIQIFFRSFLSGCVSPNYWSKHFSVNERNNILKCYLVYTTEFFFKETFSCYHFHPSIHSSLIIFTEEKKKFFRSISFFFPFFLLSQ